ncbi:MULTISPECIES: AMP-binding protein [unclassified Pseudomonas]|uniref:AMP-binding protein n=1 Tax=unclassified Pseudomonas TaxID=196821 RepID=UPI0025DC4C6F|nr:MULTISPECIES: AMP-binding protein [unclassified Pseudomonas]
MNAPSPIARRSEAGELFAASRDSLFNACAMDPHEVLAAFQWPVLSHFNWALDWFDSLAGRHEPALVLIRDQHDETISYAQLISRSNQVANWLASLGVKRGERLMVLLPNGEELYALLLGAIKLGLVIIPGYVSLTGDNLRDRLARSEASVVVAAGGVVSNIPALETVRLRIAVANPSKKGWIPFDDHLHHSTTFLPRQPTSVNEPLFGYFTSGTTSAPKLVLHTHQSYPVGHLSSVHWNGIRPGDVHLNVSAPGWAKHSWSSFFVPWTCEATIVSLQENQTSPNDLLATLQRLNVSTFCAPPTVWRALLLHGIGPRPTALREIVSAGEPLDASLIGAVREAWGLNLRNGYGQSEATAIVGFAPNDPYHAGALGYPLPGYQVQLLNQDSDLPDDEGEICLPLDSNRPLGLMLGYDQDPLRSEKALGGHFYRTGDIARRDSHGCLWYLGRTDDQFKSFDYRISPVELESALLQHNSIEQAAVVPFPDPVGLHVPKAFVVLHPDHTADAQWAENVFAHLNQKLPAELAIRHIAVVEQLPKTVTGKVTRAQLRQNAPDSIAQYRLEDMGAALQAAAVGWPQLFEGDTRGVVQPRVLSLQKMGSPDRAGIWSHTLYRVGDEGSVAALVHYEPGARANAHQHPGHELIYVLDGELRTGDQIHRKNSLLVLGPGSQHAPFSEKGASLLVIWERPVTSIQNHKEVFA